MKLYLDSETVGLNGDVKLIQWSTDETNEVYMHTPNDKPMMARLWRMLYSPEVTLIIFNLAYDTYHLYRLLHEQTGYPLDSKIRPVMPFKCKVIDLQVHAMLKSPLAPFAFSRSKSRSIATVRRIPLAAKDYVTERVLSQLAPCVPRNFSLSVSEHEVKGKNDLVSLSFAVLGRLSLKGLMQEYGLDTLKIDDVWALPPREIEKPWLPYYEEADYAETDRACDAIMSNPDSPFWKYSKLDILYLKYLEGKLGYPIFRTDVNSSCAHAVAYTRYYGFDANRAVLLRTRDEYAHRLEETERKIKLATGVEDVGTFLRSPVQRLAFLRKWFPLAASTGKNALKAMVDAGGEGGDAAAMVQSYNPTRQRLLQVEKCLDCRTEKFHPDLRVMGTATGRMAGTSGFNWQGIGQAEKPADIGVEAETADWALNDDLNDDMDEDIELDGESRIGIRAAMEMPLAGDFASFEVAIAASVYKDAQLQADLDAGIDLHSMVTSIAHPLALANKWDYEYIRGQYKADNSQVVKMRKSMKAIVFGIFYFCSAQKVAETLGVGIGEGERVIALIYERYKGIGRYRAQTERETITADTKHWTKNSVSRMIRTSTDLLGNTRHWDFEAQVAEILWGLGAQNHKTGCMGQIVRTQEKGHQTVDNAVKSAFLGSAIAIQAAVCRQLGNNPVQGSGAYLCKNLMAQLWEKYKIPMLNSHDEIGFASHSLLKTDAVVADIRAWEDEYRRIVPSLKFEDKLTRCWADK